MRAIKWRTACSKKSRILLVMAVVAIPILTLASCQSNVMSQDLPVDDEAAIYSAVIRQLATVDDTFGGNLDPKTVYVIEKTDDSAGNPIGDPQSDNHVIAETMQSEITSLLSNLAIEIVWIDKFEDAEFEESGFEVKRRGAIITLGKVYLQANGSVQIAGSIYIADLAAGGTTYILDRVDDAWEITGRAGGSWIS